MSKMRVVNDNKFIVGMRFDDGTNRELIFRPGQTRIMEEIDVANFDATSKLFQRGILKIQEKDKAEAIGIDTDIPNALSLEDAEEILKLQAPAMKNKLAKITAKHAIDKVIEAAKSPKSNLTQPKIKIINDLFQINILDDEDSTT